MIETPPDDLVLEFPYQFGDGFPGGRAEGLVHRDTYGFPREATHVVNEASLEHLALRAP